LVVFLGGPLGAGRRIFATAKLSIRWQGILISYYYYFLFISCCFIFGVWDHIL